MIIDGRSTYYDEDPEDLISTLQEHAVLSEWEEEFLDSLLTWISERELTERQHEKLTEIAEQRL